MDEVIIRQTYSQENLYTNVIVAEVEPQSASVLLSELSTKLPLQQFGLLHLKRIRSKRMGNGSILQLIVCPEALYGDISEDLKSNFDHTSVVSVCKIPPQCRSEFLLWGERWPINFHASQLEKDREAGFTSKEISQFSYACGTLKEENYLISQLSDGKITTGALIVNPVSGSVVARSSESFLRMVALYDKATVLTAYETIFTPVMMCIDQVAAIVSGQVDNDGLLAEDHYLCSGLDLYTTVEPDLMSCMGLVHSRIRRVYFQYTSEPYGALESSPAHIHSLRSLNHNFRVFRIKDNDSAMGNEHNVVKNSCISSNGNKSISQSNEISSHLI